MRKAFCLPNNHTILKRDKIPKMVLIFLGYRKPVQRPESGTVTATRQGRAEIGQIPRIRRCHVDSAAMLLYVSCSLAGLHLVFNR